MGCVSGRTKRAATQSAATRERAYARRLEPCYSWGVGYGLACVRDVLPGSSQPAHRRPARGRKRAPCPCRRRQWTRSRRYAAPAATSTRHAAGIWGCECTRIAGGSTARHRPGGPLRKTVFTVPVGPLRCLPMRISAMPGSWQVSFKRAMTGHFSSLASAFRPPVISPSGGQLTFATIQLPKERPCPRAATGRLYRKRKCRRPKI